MDGERDAIPDRRYHQAVWWTRQSVSVASTREPHSRRAALATATVVGMLRALCYAFVLEKEEEEDINYQHKRLLIQRGR